MHLNKQVEISYLQRDEAGIELQIFSDIRKPKYNLVTDKLHGFQSFFWFQAYAFSNKTNKHF